MSGDQIDRGLSISPARSLMSAPSAASARRYVLLMLSAGLLALSIGNATAPAAAWLAPVLMLRFVRGSGWLGIAAGAIAMAIAHVVAWRGTLPFQGSIYYAVTAAAGVALFTPYLVDRLLAPRLAGLMRSLVFPAAWVAVEFAYSRVGFGTWGLVGYSQYGELPLLQLISVTGMLGLTFLIGWFASLVNAAWEAGWRGASVRRHAAIYAGVIAFVLMAGGLRLALLPPRAETVRVAGVTVDNLEAFRGTWGPLTYGRPFTPELAELARRKVQDLQAALLDRTAQEAIAGAKIIVWTEGNALVFRSDEAEFVRKAQRVAAEHGVYLFLSLASMAPGEPLVENKVVVIEPTGAVHSSYLKSHPTPGEMSVPGDGRVGVIDTPYGRLAWAICYDFDYPELIRQAGRAGADILIDPSWDSRGMDPMHSHMAAFRAIENGASLFRPVNGGLGLAVDHQGRVLAAMDHYTTPGEVKSLVADLPTRGARTVYPWIGDLAAWGALLLLLGVGAQAAGRLKRHQAGSSVAPPVDEAN